MGRRIRKNFKRRVRKFKKFTRKFKRTFKRRTEIKFDDQAVDSTVLTSGVSVINNLSPLSIVKGTSEVTRIGARINLRKVKIEWAFYGDGTVSLIPRLPESRYRFLVWTPRIAYANSLAYMQQLGADQVPDHNVVTIYMDKRFCLKAAYDWGATTPVNGSGTPFVRTGKWLIPFKRTAKFQQTGVVTGQDLLDVNKDVLYYMFFTFDLGGHFLAQSRTFYTDE